MLKWSLLIGKTKYALSTGSSNHRDVTWQLTLLIKNSSLPIASSYVGNFHQDHNTQNKRNWLFFLKESILNKNAFKAVAGLPNHAQIYCGLLCFGILFGANQPFMECLVVGPPKYSIFIQPHCFFPRGHTSFLWVFRNRLKTVLLQ